MSRAGFSPGVQGGRFLGPSFPPPPQRTLIPEDQFAIKADHRVEGGRIKTKVEPQVERPLGRAVCLLLYVCAFLVTPHHHRWTKVQTAGASL